MTTVSELRRHNELFSNLTLRELRGKYKRSVLGWGWSMLNPLAQMVTYSLVFGFFLKIEPPVGEPSGIDSYALFLLGGLLPWTFLAAGLQAGMGSLLGNANLVKKVYFPREILVAATVASYCVSFLIELGVYAAALLVADAFADDPFSLRLFAFLPVTLLVVAIQAGFVLGLALLLSVCTVYLRDLEYLVGIVLGMWVYATPVLYPISIVEEALVNHPGLFRLYELNPMTRFVEVYRDLLYSQTLPSARSVAYLLGCTVVVLVIGLRVFTRLEGRLAEEL
jgi:ABC-2 type transport system permease protein